MEVDRHLSPVFGSVLAFSIRAALVAQSFALLTENVL
jgi:hypothetical protein